MDDTGTDFSNSATDTPGVITTDLSKVQLPEGVIFDPYSFGGYTDWSQFANLGLKPGDLFQGIDANTFSLARGNNYDNNLWQRNEYNLNNGKWSEGKMVNRGYDSQGSFLGDAFKALAPLAVNFIPGIGTGLSSLFGGGLTGSIGAGSLLGGLGSAASGQSFGKGALLGGLTSGIGAGIKEFNPAGQLGIGNSNLGNLFNNTLTTGINTAIRGGDVGKALGSSLLTGGLSYAGKQLGLGKGSNNMDFNTGFGDTSMFSGNELTGGFGSYQPNDFEQAMQNINNIGQGGGGFEDPYGFYSGSINQYDPNTVAQAQGNPVASFLKSMLLGGSAGKGAAGLGDMVGSLMGLYQANRNRKAINSQIDNLGGMFSQNSPYATQLRQQLARRDAAGGRRSQYGPREVELQAALATANQRNAPALSQLYQGQNNNREMMLRNLLQLGNQSGAFKGLADLFGG